MTDTRNIMAACPDLINLPNGDWADPRDIRGIAYLSPTAGYGSAKEYGDRVRIDLWGGGVVVLEFGDAIEAVTFRDDLAARTNVARRSIVLDVEFHHG